MKFAAVLSVFLAAQVYGFDNRCKVTQREPRAANKLCVDFTDAEGNVWDTCTPFSVVSPQNPPDNTAGKQWCATSADFDINSEDPDVNGLWGVCQDLVKACLFVAPTEAPAPATKRPSASPTVRTKRPSASPTAPKTKRPSASPTPRTKRPSKNPTAKPTKKGTSTPTCGGTGKKSCAPTTPTVETEAPVVSPEYESTPTDAPVSETGAPTSTVAPTVPVTATTAAPTVAVTTVAPTTKAPTFTGDTLAPTSVIPSTKSPTSVAPTSRPAGSSTVSPTTVQTSTSSPTVAGESSFIQIGAASVAVVFMAVFQVMI